MVVTESIVIADPGGANARRLPVVEVQTSTGINEVGAFSCFVRADDLRRAGLGLSPTGSWLSWAHPAAGRWGGTVIGAPASGEFVEIEAEGWAGMLRGRVLEQGATVPSGGAGGLAAHIVRLARQDEPTFLTIGTVEDGGTPVLGDFIDQDVLDDVLPELAENGGIEWVVDADRVFHVMRRLGRDRSASVRLVEGRDFPEPRFVDDGWTQAAAEVLVFSPRVAAFPEAPQGGGNRRRRRRRKRGNRRRWRIGRRVTETVETTFTTLPGSDATLDDTAALAPGVGLYALTVPENPAFSAPSSPVQLEVAPRVGARCDLGDVVWMVAGSVGFAGWFRIMARGYDAASQTITLAGEAMARDRGRG